MPVHHLLEYGQLIERVDVAQDADNNGRPRLCCVHECDRCANLSQSFVFDALGVTVGTKWERAKDRAKETARERRWWQAEGGVCDV